MPHIGAPIGDGDDADSGTGLGEPPDVDLSEEEIQEILEQLRKDPEPPSVPDREPSRPE